MSGLLTRWFKADGAGQYVFQRAVPYSLVGFIFHLAKDRTWASAIAYALVWAVIGAIVDIVTWGVKQSRQELRDLDRDKR